jgi:hypothetical protein
MQRALWTCGRDLDPEACGAPPGFFLYPGRQADTFGHARLSRALERAQILASP